MGWYIRKALTRGPIRFNLSKGGLGISVGVKGARIGICPRGTYVHFGRGGLYYRQYLQTPANGRRDHGQPGPREVEVVPSVDGGDIVPTMSQDSSPSEFVKHLQEKQPAPLGFLIAFLVGFVAVTIAFIINNGNAILVSIGWSVVFGALSLPRPKPMVVMYEIDPEVEKALQLAHEGLETIGQCARLWVQHSTATSDWKRNAGVSSLVKRQAASLVSDDQSLLKANVPIPKLSSAGFELWFLPDQAILRQSGRLTNLDYVATSVTSNLVRFVESDPLPGDTQVVGKTWQYVNRSGGPDRRFNNNRQLPIALYGRSVLSAKNGWTLELSMSRAPGGQLFATCWQTFALLHTELKGIVSPNIAPT